MVASVRRPRGGAVEELAAIALRVTVVYLYTLALLRLTGKRTIGALAPIDLVIAFVVGDMFDDIIWAEVPLSMGIVGITTIMALHFVAEYLSFRSPRLEQALVGNRVPVVKDGRLLEDGLQRERLTGDDLWSLLRLKGVEQLDEVRQATLEPSGDIGVLEEEEAKPADRRDLRRVLERVK